jgi:hypothetical protein
MLYPLSYGGGTSTSYRLEHPRPTGGPRLDDSSPQREQLTVDPKRGCHLDAWPAPRGPGRFLSPKCHHLVATCEQCRAGCAIRHSNVDGWQCKRSSVNVYTLEISL